MNTIEISKAEFEKLEKKFLQESINHGEGEIFLLPNSSSEGFLAIKKLYKSSGLYFSNKLFTLNSLIDNREKISIPDLILPEKILSIDGHVEAFTMPYIDGINLNELLADKTVSIEKKIEYLKKIGQLLQKIKDCRKNARGLRFYLNDLHESNFIIERKSGELKAIDLDSCSIDGNYPFGAKYLSSLTPLKNYPSKYNSDLNISCGGEFIPDENTDLYCYTILVLNFLFKGRVHLMTEDEFFKYLDYLESIGADKELLDVFGRVYTPDDNINFAELLDCVPHFYDKADCRIYFKKQK